MSDWGSAILVVGSLGGVALGWLGTLSSERRRDLRERQREAATRTSTRHDRREEFELQHLLACREHLTDAMVLATRIRHEYAQGQRTFDRAPSIDAHYRVDREAELILDDDLRELVKSALNGLSNITPSDGYSPTQDESLEGFQLWEAANSGIAAGVRRIYEGM